MFHQIRERLHGIRHLPAERGRWPGNEGEDIILISSLEKKVNGEEEQEQEREGEDIDEGEELEWLLVFS